MLIPLGIDLTPTWGEIGLMAARLALSKETGAYRALTPELAKAMGAAQALTRLTDESMLTPEQTAFAQKIIADEMCKMAPVFPPEAERGKS